MYTLEAALILSPGKLAVAKNKDGRTIVVRELPEQYEGEMHRQIYQYQLSCVNTDGTLGYDHIVKYWQDFDYDLRRFLPEANDNDDRMWFPVGYTSPF